MKFTSTTTALIASLLFACVNAQDETFTRQECEDAGNIVVGDIGNGAIFEPDYICESSGEPPVGTIVPGPNEPIASEGDVCCGPGQSEGGGLQCGPSVCSEGQECCNESCGICTEPGGMCIQEFCTVDGEEPSVISEPIDLPNDNDGDASWQDRTLTRQECENRNGEVIGDIGNGAIFEDDYTCENGAPPLSRVVPVEGEPIATEGEICCSTIPFMTANATDNGGGSNPANGTGTGIAERPVMSFTECEEAGGVVVYDVGNGAIYQEDYKCDVSGEAPMAQVISSEEESNITATARSSKFTTDEGQVCCATEATTAFSQDNASSASKLFSTAAGALSLIVMIAV